MKPRKKLFGLKLDLLLLYAIVLGIYRPMSFVPWAMYREGDADTAKPWSVRLVY
jgi:hypothetical protein